MIKALIFMIKAGLLVALAVWLAGRPGAARLEWQDYSVTVQMGLFLSLALATVLLGIFVYNVIRTFTGFPASYRRYRQIRNREKGLRALTIGLTAVAAGDGREAERQAGRARKWMAEGEGLPLLLEAQAARLQGREDDARRSFARLAGNRDAGFLGLRGLLQAALDTQSDAKALELAREALKLHPKQGWLLRLAYDLELRLQRWDAAAATLRRMERGGIMAPAKAANERAAILLAEAEEDRLAGRTPEALAKAKKAVQADSAFAPASVRLARLHEQAGQRPRAVRAVRKAWKAAPHPDLAALWAHLFPATQAAKPMARLKWAGELLKIHPDDPAALEAAGQAAIEEGLWGEARKHLMRAEALAPTARLYRLLAELEAREGHAQSKEHWLKKAVSAPQAPCWVCRETGSVHEGWRALSGAAGTFNTLEWRVPETQEGARRKAFTAGAPEIDMLDARGILTARN